MKSMMTLSALAVLLAAGLTAPAEAGDRAARAANNNATVQRDRNKPPRSAVERNTHVTLANGQEASREHSRTVDRENGTWTASTTTTDGQGRVGTREVQGAVDRENHSYSREVTGTTRGGVDYNVNASGSRDPETGSFQRQADRSNSNGQSASTVVTGQRTENGMVRDRTTTLGDGRTASAHTEVVRQDDSRTVSTTGTTLQGEAFSRTNTVTRTEEGVVRDLSSSGPKGERSRHDEVVRDAATGTTARTSSGSNANGDWTANAVTTRTDNGLVRDASRTNANGQTVSEHGELVRNDDGTWVRTQTTSGANGGSRTVTINGSVDAETGAVNREVNVDRTPPPKP